MTKRYSRHVQVFFGGYDPGTATTQFEVAIEQPGLDTTSMGDAAERMIANIRADTFTWAGWYDDGSAGMNEAGSAYIGTVGTHTVKSVMIGTISGTLSTAIGYSGQVLQTVWKAPVSINELVRQSAEFSVNQAVDRGGAILLESIAATATGNTNAHDHGGATTGTGTLYLHVVGGVFGTDGTATGTVHLDHSTSGTGTWTSIATLGAIGSVNSYLGTWSGTLRRYTRLRMINAGSSMTMAGNVKRSGTII